MKLAIISDLHIGEYARARDFTTGDSEHAVIENFIEQFESYFGKEEYQCDALLVAGDITNRAKANEYQLAAERILDVAKVLNVEEDAIFFTPGNHDSNWEMGKTRAEQGELCEDKIRETRYEFLNGNGFFSSRVNSAKFGRFDLKPYFVLWTTPDLAVLSYNSAADDSHNDKIHHGKISTSLIKLLREQLEGANCNIDDKVKILLLHHHPINYEDKSYIEPDFSIMTNGNAIIDFAAEKCFDFIVHGHKHVPRYKQIITEHQYPINVLCSGSFSARLDDRWFNGIGNSFHIIEVDGLCEDEYIPKGRILSWSHFVKHGWQKNILRRDEITHEERFGSSLNRKALQLKLKRIIEENFKLKDHIQWSEVCSFDDTFNYCSSTVVSIILKELSKEMGFRIFQEPEVVLLNARGKTK